MTRLVQFFRSTRLARALLISLGAYIAVAAWLPWTRTDVAATPAPGWAVAMGLDHPYAAPPFLLLGLALFLSTWACTWGRRARIAAQRRGDLPPGAPTLPVRPGVDAAAFLRSQGFSGPGPVFRRFGPALWGGWVFHVGLLVLMAAVLAQQAFHDGGQFELAEGEQVVLSAPGVGFGRVRGPLAPAEPPPLSVGLLRFDPALHQRGYAADRASLLRLALGDGAPADLGVDRADGVQVGPVTVYQAIPSGVTVTFRQADGHVRAVHLRDQAPQRASAFITDPTGAELHFIVEAERPFGDPRGTGALLVKARRGAAVEALRPGATFDFGGTTAEFLEVGRWAGFTWARNPGLPFVFLGFGLILLGALLLVFPSAVAREGPGGVQVLGRGFEVLAERWAALAPRPGQ